jgi:hypothetical protein
MTPKRKHIIAFTKNLEFFPSQYAISFFIFIPPSGVGTTYFSPCCDTDFATYFYNWLPALRQPLLGIE